MKIVVFLSAIFLFSCTKDKAECSTCVQSIKNQIQNEPVRNPAGKIFSYSYQGRTVYYVPSYCCDMMSTLYDENCNIICHPDGGFSGSGDGNCTDFFQARSNEKLIWADPR